MSGTRLHVFQMRTRRTDSGQSAILRALYLFLQCFHLSRKRFCLVLCAGASPLRKLQLCLEDIQSLRQLLYLIRDLVRTLAHQGCSV
mmetsp:Transcript_11976/g.25656  ORF Transcript_11976/g.25656 Transcript_11976/m.25656 type:complete len:87 (-) Transcript_11976:257-517(-)